MEVDRAADERRLQGVGHTFAPERTLAAWLLEIEVAGPRYGLRTGLFFNKVYVFGGKFHSADKILSYNEATDEWQEEGGMMVNRRWHEVLVIENVPCPGPDPSTGLWQQLLSLLS